MSVPKLRFKVFDGEWEEKLFGKIIKIISGKGFKASEYSTSGIRLLQIENVGYGTIKWSKNTVHLPKNYALEYPDLILKEGDIVLALNRPVTNNELKIARLLKNDEPSILYQRVGKFKLIEKSLSEDFIFHSARHFIKTFVERQSIGSDQPFISVLDLYAKKVLIPQSGEQQKIADCLSSLDEQITAQNQYIHTLQQHKKGLMQKLFVANGQTVPELRFKGFENVGVWTAGVLSDLINSLDAGVSVNSEDTPPSEGEYSVLKTSCLTGNQFNSDARKVVKQEAEIERLKEKVKDNSIVLSRMNTPELVGASAYVALAPKLTYLPDRLWQLKTKSNVDNYWLAAWLSSDNTFGKIKATATGTSNSMKNITKPALLALDVYYPTKPEQQKIADCLSSLDELITAEQAMLAALKLHKKGLMQQLFVQGGV